MTARRDLAVGRDQRRVRGHGLLVLQPGTGVDDHDLVALVEPARFAQLRDRGEARGAFRADPGPFGPRRLPLAREQLLVGHGHRGSAGGPDRLEYQEAAERLGNGEPERLGLGVRPRLGLVCLPLECAHDRRAARRLHRDQAWQGLADPAQLPQLAQPLGDADQANAAAGREDDHVGHPPAELLGYFQPDRLLAFQPVGLPERGRVQEPRPARHGGPDETSRIADEPVDQVRLGPGRHALGPGDLRCIGRHDDQAGQPGPGREGRPGRPGVAVRRQGHAGGPELGRARHSHRRPAGLERAGGERALVFHQQPGHAKLRAQALHRQQRRHALVKAHYGLGRAHRQQLVVAPQARRPRGDLVRARP